MPYKALSRDPRRAAKNVVRNEHRAILSTRLVETRAEGKEVMGRRSTWTSKDDDLLRALAASGENSAAIAARLKRTAAGIRKRATSLGIGLAGSRKALGLKAKK